MFVLSGAFRAEGAEVVPHHVMQLSSFVWGGWVAVGGFRSRYVIAKHVTPLCRPGGFYSESTCGGVVFIDGTTLCDIPLILLPVLCVCVIGSHDVTFPTLCPPGV